MFQIAFVSISLPDQGRLSEQSSSLTFGEIDLLQLDVSVGETRAYSLERLTYIEKFLSRDNSTSAKMIFPVIFLKLSSEKLQNLSLHTADTPKAFSACLMHLWKQARRRFQGHRASSFCAL